MSFGWPKSVLPQLNILDSKEANALLAKAKDNHPPSVFELGSRLLNGDSQIVRNVEQAVYWLDLAYELKHPGAKEESAIAHVVLATAGQGDYKEHLQIAIDRGHKAAQVQLNALLMQPKRAN